jgi:hypothetical protein
LPDAKADWSLTRLQSKLIKIGASFALQARAVCGMRHLIGRQNQAILRSLGRQSGECRLIDGHPQTDFTRRGRPIGASGLMSYFMFNSLRKTVKSIVPAAGLDHFKKARTAIRRRRMLRDLRRDIRQGSDGRKYVTYLVMQGLTNRFKAHLMAAHYAEQLGRTLVPVWYKTPECHASFEDVFSNSAPAWSYQTKRVVGYDVARNRASAEISDMKDDHSDLLILDLDWQYTYMPRLTDRIGGTQKFADLFAQTLNVRDDIKSRVATTVAAWGCPMIGVQLRRGDFVKLGMSVPTEHYITAAKMALATRPDAKIYLASDATRSELAPFLDHFGTKCVFTERKGRDNEEGIRDAMYDLLLLSRCSYLILTKFSGFGHMAAQIGAVPFEWVE